MKLKILKSECVHDYKEVVKDMEKMLTETVADVMVSYLRGKELTIELKNKESNIYLLIIKKGKRIIGKLTAEYK